MCNALFKTKTLLAFLQDKHNKYLFQLGKISFLTSRTNKWPLKNSHAKVMEVAMGCVQCFTVY